MVELTIQQHFLASLTKDEYNVLIIQYIDDPDSPNPLSPQKLSKSTLSTKTMDNKPCVREEYHVQKPWAKRKP